MQVVGRLAEKRAATEHALQGLLVRHGAQDSIMHPADLPYFTKLHPGRVLQRQLLPLDKPFSEVQLQLLFEEVVQPLLKVDAFAKVSVQPLEAVLHPGRVLQRQLLPFHKPFCEIGSATA